jgi:hypothetical protein
MTRNATLRIFCRLTAATLRRGEFFSSQHKDAKMQ